MGSPGPFTLCGRAPIPKYEIVLPIAGIAYLGFVIFKQSAGQPAPFSYFPWIAGAWYLAGAVVLLVPRAGPAPAWPEEATEASPRCPRCPTSNRR
ncbi:hypothetical protein AB0H34_09305 [Saccharopolyspora shandongensis]|uniref:hypothetical protein n=1 Tax=Saccharopolyspora shandongensis TaxID=418495 RepID=UPI0033DAC67C